MILKSACFCGHRHCVISLCLKDCSQEENAWRAESKWLANCSQRTSKTLANGTCVCKHSHHLRDSNKQCFLECMLIRVRAKSFIMTMSTLHTPLLPSTQNTVAYSASFYMYCRSDRSCEGEGPANYCNNIFITCYTPSLPITQYSVTCNALFYMYH